MQKLSNVKLNNFIHYIRIFTPTRMLQSLRKSCAAVHIASCRNDCKQLIKSKNFLLQGTEYFRFMTGVSIRRFAFCLLQQSCYLLLAQFWLLRKKIHYLCLCNYEQRPVLNRKTACQSSAPSFRSIFCLFIITNSHKEKPEKHEEFHKKDVQLRF